MRQSFCFRWWSSGMKGVTPTFMLPECLPTPNLTSFICFLLLPCLSESLTRERMMPILLLGPYLMTTRPVFVVLLAPVLVWTWWVHEFDYHGYQEEDMEGTTQWYTCCTILNVLSCRTARHGVLHVLQSVTLHVLYKAILRKRLCCAKSCVPDIANIYPIHHMLEIRSKPHPL